MTKGRPIYRVLEHTADAKIEVAAPTLAVLFEHAAAAMFDVMVDIDRVATQGVARELSVAADERETLLLAWLSGALSMAMVEGVVFGAFSVDALTDRDVRGVLWGEPLDIERHGFKTEIKAVTYHDLEVREAGGQFVARIVFDI